MRISDWSSDVCSSDLDLSTEHSRSLALSIARLAAFADPTADEYRIGVARELLATDHASFALRELQKIESGSPFASAATDVRIAAVLATGDEDRADRKSTRLNSSH